MEEIKDDCSNLIWQGRLVSELEKDELILAIRDLYNDYKSVFDKMVLAETKIVEWMNIARDIKTKME